MEVRKPERVLKLRTGDKARIAKFEVGKMTQRNWLRLQALKLLALGRCVDEVARGLGTYPRVVRRVRDEYLREGIEAALNDKPRPNRKQAKLDDGQAAKVVSIACSAPPVGRARWTAQLIAEEATRKGVAPKVTAKDVLKVMKRHALKPWREKNVVRTEIRRRIRLPNGKSFEVVLGEVVENRPAGVP